MRTFLGWRHAIGAALLALLLPGGLPAQIVESGTGANAAAITPSRDAFRVDLGGGTVAGPNGSFGGVRREINWDGVPDNRSAPNNLPADFFNVTSPRGVIFSTAGTGFQVSANAGVAPIAFDNINPGYASTFAAFSPQRLFTALDSTVTDVAFFVPGTNIPSLVKGFGAIFSDVDVPNTTSITYFDQNNNTLGTFFVPALVGDQTFSFLGVSFPTPVVSRVRIVTGNRALGAGVPDQNGTTNDLVVLDDFLFGEPLAVPEPSGLTLLGFGIVGVLGYAWRRKQAA